MILPYMVSTICETFIAKKIIIKITSYRRQQVHDQEFAYLSDENTGFLLYNEIDNFEDELRSWALEGRI